MAAKTEIGDAYSVQSEQLWSSHACLFDDPVDPLIRVDHEGGKTTLAPIPLSSRRTMCNAYGLYVICVDDYIQLHDMMDESACECDIP